MKVMRANNIIWTVVCMSDCEPKAVPKACSGLNATQRDLAVTNINKNATDCYWILSKKDKNLHTEEDYTRAILSKLCAHDVTLQRIALCQSRIIWGSQSKEIEWWAATVCGARCLRRTTDVALQSALILRRRNRIKNYYRGLLEN